MRNKCSSVKKNEKRVLAKYKAVISNNIQVENNDIVLFNDNIIVNKHFANVTKDIGKCDKGRNGQFNRYYQHSHTCI